MRKFSKQFRYGEKGFTLIELLMIVLLLGVLAASVIPNVLKFTKSGYAETANLELGSLRTAVSVYMTYNGGAIPSAISDVEDYLATDLKASYTINTTTGEITGTDPTSGNWGFEKIQWDGTNKKWIKA